MSAIAVSPSFAPSSSAAQGSRVVAWGRYARVAFATVVAALLANLLVYVLGDVVVGYDPDFVVLATIGGTVTFTLFFAIGAVLVYAALLRYTARPARHFGILSAIVFVVTTVPDFTYIPGVEGSSNGQVAVLVLMHVVAAAVIVGMLTKLARAEGR